MLKEMRNMYWVDCWVAQGEALFLGTMYLLAGPHGQRPGPRALTSMPLSQVWLQGRSTVTIKEGYNDPWS